MAIKLIIFDLDGTLVDSSRDISNALSSALAAFGIEPVSVGETEELIGGGLTKLIESLLGKKRIDLDKSQLLDAFLHHYSCHLTDHTRPYPQVAETLTVLKGPTMVILSNKITSFTLEIVKRFGLASFFASILGGDAVPEKKPSPNGITALLAQLSIEKSEAMIVGDSFFDVEAGRRAGVHTVAAMYGYGMPGFDEDAEFRIETFAELQGIVRGLQHFPDAS